MNRKTHFNRYFCIATVEFREINGDLCGSSIPCYNNQKNVFFLPITKDVWEIVKETYSDGEDP